MKRYTKGMIVLIGWSLVYVIILIITAPIISIFQDPITQEIPFDLVIPAAITAVTIAVPLIYSAIYLLVPLAVATLEVFEDGC